MVCKGRAIRLAERAAKNEGRTFCIVKLCGDYDFIAEEDVNPEQTIVHKVVPDNRATADMELGAG